MKQSRRWVAWLATLLIAASLTVLPREGAAKGPYVDGLPGSDEGGEPDGPPPAPVSIIQQPLTWSLSLRFEYGRLFVLLVPVRALPTRDSAPSKNKAR